MPTRFQLYGQWVVSLGTLFLVAWIALQVGSAKPADPSPEIQALRNELAELRGLIDGAGGIQYAARR